MQIAIVLALGLSICAWAYCNPFYYSITLPYRGAYPVLSILLWLVVGVDFVHYLGWKLGLIWTAACLAFAYIFLAKIARHFYYQSLLGSNPMRALTLLWFMTLVNGGLAIASFYWPD